MLPRLSRRRLLKWAGLGGLSAKLSASGYVGDSPENAPTGTKSFRASDPPFYAMGEGRTDETRQLRAALNAAIATGNTLTLRGSYRVSGPLGDVQIKARGTLNLHIDGDVEIVVDPDAPAIDTLLFCLTQDPLNSRITGGTLRLRLNNRCAAGLVVRYLSNDPRAGVDWRASIQVEDALNTAENDSTNNHGIVVGGRYRRVEINRPVVTRIARERKEGETKALAVFGYTGQVIINAPHLSVATAPPGCYDVDLLSLFPAEDPRGPFYRRQGTAIVRNGVFIDTQGRSIKLQGRARLSGNRYIRTGKVKAMVESCEVDAQFDEIQESGARYEYGRGTDGSSPLGRNHLLVSVQHLIQDATMTTQLRQFEIKTEIQLRNFAAINRQPSSTDNTVIISWFSATKKKAFKEALFSRSLVEIDAPKISAAAGKTSVFVSEGTGPFGAMILGYSGATKPLSGKLEIWVTRNRNTGASTPLVGSLSGPRAQSDELLHARGNSGWTTAEEAKR